MIEGENEAERFAVDAECFGADRIPDPERVECGTVTVPLDHQRPDGEQIELAVVVIAAGDERQGGPPMLVLGGGPGGHMVEPALTNPEAFAVGGQETIVLDQRGVGLSTPELACPEVAAALPTRVLTDEAVEVLRECREGLAAEGIELGAFNDRNNALDVDVVRAALGHDEVDVQGTSYGGHLALHAAARNPDGVRSLVLIAPVDPSRNRYEVSAAGFEAALDRVSEACAASAACAEQIDVHAAIDDVVERLGEQPEPVRPLGRDELTVTPAVFLDALFSLFYLPQGAHRLPALLTEARDGDLEPLIDHHVQVQEQPLRNTTFGLFAAMECSSDGGLADPDAVGDLLTSGTLVEDWLPHSAIAGGDATRALCEAMDVEVAHDPADFVFADDVPALIATGEADHVTPTTQAETIADALQTAHQVEVPSAGHAVLATLDLFVGNCGDQLIDQFLTDPQQPPDDACVHQVPALESALERHLE